MTAPLKTEGHPLISICIPTYNAGAYLEPCLLSAVKQTYSPTEILICDDGSSDDTISIVQQFSRQYPKIRLVQNNVNGGMVHNWNRCIEEARGEWIKFLFQDDLLAPSCVEDLLTACRQHRVPVGLCRRDFLIHENAPAHLRRFFSSEAPKAEHLFGCTSLITPQQLAEAVKQHLVQNFLGEPTCYFFQRQFCVEQGLFRTDLKQVVDYEFIIRLGLVKGLAFVAQPLAFFRVHGHSESSSNTQPNKAAQQRIIAAETGDFMLLVDSYLHQPCFALVREAVGENVLLNYVKHLYHSACKHKGAAVVNAALRPLLQAHEHLRFRYSFFNYVRYRRLHKQWEKSIRAGKPSGNSAA